MWWFAIPVVAIAAKKIYDAVTEGSSSSSTSYSDNVGEKEREARTAENIKRHNARAKRQQEQAELMLHQELKNIRQQFLHDITLPARFSQDVLKAFIKSDYISNSDTAEAALSDLCRQPVKLKKLPCDSISIKAQLAEIQSLEKFIKGF